MKFAAVMLGTTSGVLAAFKIKVAPNQITIEMMIDERNSLIGAPERGEIAAFTTPDGGGSEIYVRRVVAVEGNDVEIKGGRLYVNGLAESGSESDGERPDLPKTTVPAGYVFVLADNPGYDPSDSGTGLVDLRSILGVVRFAYRR